MPVTARSSSLFVCEASQKGSENVYFLNGDVLPGVLTIPFFRRISCLSLVLALPDAGFSSSISKDQKAGVDAATLKLKTCTRTL